MKIRTLTQLEDFLDEELSWRKKDLTLSLSNYLSSNDKKKDFYLRILIFLIYSHWEGFIKKSSEVYLEYISSCKVNLSSMQSNFIALSLDNNDINNKKGIVDFILKDAIQYKFQFKKGQINTKSNLNIEILENICNAIGVNKNQLNIDLVWIDERLLKYRNAIAHGEKVVAEQITFNLSELKNKIQSNLDIYKTLISNAACTKSYLN